jgi:peptidoglycan/xylan/chitin deacetylase (PgdA/CDA1 family)
MSFKRAIDFLSDRRMPQFAPSVYVKSHALRKKVMNTPVPTDKEIPFVLTFDIEDNLDPTGQRQRDIEHDISFFKKVVPMLNSQKCPSTFFVQGNLISEISPILKEVEDKDEIGLHGFHHELWGDEKWFSKHKALPLQVKKNLLKEALDAFSSNNLERPTSFRAPDMILNHETSVLLKEDGFTVDSSFPSYMGFHSSLPQQSDPLVPMSIPITSSPFPSFSFKYLIPFARYNLLNMNTLRRLTDEELLELIETVLRYEHFLGVSPQIVFLSHSWDYLNKGSSPKFWYCSESNFEFLFKKLSLIKEKLPIKFVTMRQLSKGL